MTDTTIQGLALATLLSPTDTLPSDQADGVTRKMSLQQMQAYLVAAGSALAAPAAGLVYSDGAQLHDVVLGAGVSYAAGTLTAAGTFSLPDSAVLLGSNATGLGLPVTLGAGLSMTGAVLATTHQLPASAALLGSDATGAPLAITPGAGLALTGSVLAATPAPSIAAYFHGTNASNSLTVPAQTLTQVPLTAARGGALTFNASTGTYTVNVAGVYALSGTARFADAGTTGGAAAGVRVGLNVYVAISTVGMQWSQMGQTSTTAFFERETFFNVGQQLVFLAYSDTANIIQSSDFYIQLING